MEPKRYYLMDLERTIKFSHPYYWKANKNGYTPDLEEAGTFDEAEAKEIVETDFDKRTVMIGEKVVEGILR